MTRGFLRVPIMRPNCCWTFLHVSILSVLLLTLNADSEDSDCYSQIKVRRNTIYKILEGEDLIISCPVVFCNSSPPAVFWFKLQPTYVPVDVSNQSHIKTDWEELKELEAISYLIFQKTRSSDAGLYQCQIGSDVGHGIIVLVHGGEELSTVTWNNNTNSTDPDPSPDKWMYVYSAAGIGAFVFLVIVVSVISMRGCRGKSRRETQSENQYMAIHMVEDLSPRQSASDQSSVSTPQRHKCVYREVKQDEERTGTAVENGGSVVYAALNHQLPPGAAPRPQRKQEESSVYAAIRVS